jgi:transposase
MAYRYGDRYQMNMFPQSIEEYVSEDDAVRAYDAFVGTLNFKELGIHIEADKEGNPQYDPEAMVKLFLYGCSYGIRSSRKLERACYHNISFIWLMGGLNPDHKTISEFRKKNKKALAGIIKQCAQLCVKLGLIEGNTLFTDGTKIRANASINNTFTKERAERLLANIDKRIEQILNECETADDKERDESSHVKLSGELKDNQTLKNKIATVLEELKATQKKSINISDNECVKVKGRQGLHAGYNGQITVDEKHGLIVNSDVVAESTDINQFSSQIGQAQTVLGHPCKNACADAGYANTDDLKQIHDSNITVVVPTKVQAHDRKPGPFDKENFTYNKADDCYVCPEGHTLYYTSDDTSKNHRIYRISNKKLCSTCKNYGPCTTAGQGRKIRRLVNEDTKAILEQTYRAEMSQQIYKLRKEKVEHPFGHIKRNLGVASFLLRGVQSAKAEMSIFSSCFNIARMITLCCGVEGFIVKLSTC